MVSGLLERLLLPRAHHRYDHMIDRGWAIQRLPACIKREGIYVQKVGNIN
jgi:hypothetical protein